MERERATERDRQTQTDRQRELCVCMHGSIFQSDTLATGNLVQNVLLKRDNFLTISQFLCVFDKYIPLHG